MVEACRGYWESHRHNLNLQNPNFTEHIASNIFFWAIALQKRLLWFPKTPWHYLKKPKQTSKIIKYTFHSFPIEQRSSCWLNTSVGIHLFLLFCSPWLLRLQPCASFPDTAGPQLCSTGISASAAQPKSPAPPPLSPKLTRFFVFTS